MDLTGIFPLLPIIDKQDEGEEAQPGDIVVKHRLNWLQKAQKSTQEEYFVTWRHQEPENSFTLTMATLSKLSPDVMQRYLEMEKDVAAKKLTMLWARSKKIMSLYDIAMQSTDQGKSRRFKLPYQKKFSESTPLSDVASTLASLAFPLGAIPHHCSGIKVSDSALDLARSFFAPTK